MSAPLYSMDLRISVVMMRHADSGLMLTSPVSRPTCGQHDEHSQMSRAEDSLGMSPVLALPVTGTNGRYMTCGTM